MFSATRNAVSERFISRATSCIQRSSRAAGSTHTAAGLPAYGVLVNASTWTIVRPMRSKLAACRAVGLKIPVEPERRRPVKETVLVPDDERGLHVVVREDEPQLAEIGRASCRERV